MTRSGADPLLSAEENIADLVEPPTEEEMQGAITRNLRHLLFVVRYLPAPRGGGDLIPRLTFPSTR